VAIAAGLLLPRGAWVSQSLLQHRGRRALASLELEIQSVLATPVTRRVSLARVRLFTFILINNFIGLLPFVFTGTRHLVFTGVLRVSL